MSYAEDDCAGRFTAEQIQAMRTYVQEEQSHILEVPIVEEPIVDAPQLNFPIGREPVPANDIVLSWEPVPNATHYVVQVGITSTFPGTDGNYETTETSLRLPELRDNKKYFWRVRPYNLFNTCTEYSITETLQTTSVTTSIQTIEGLEDLSIYPTTAPTGSTIQVQLQTSKRFNGQINIVDLTGRILYTRDITNNLGNQSLSIETNTLPAGVYFIGVNDGIGQATQRVVLY